MSEHDHTGLPTPDVITASIKEGMARVNDAMATAGQVIGDALVRAMETIRRLYDSLGYQPGDPVTPDHRIIRATGRSGRGWLAWRIDRWVPVHRVRGVGWVWSE